MFVKSQNLEEMCNNMDAIYSRVHPHLTPTGTHSCMCSNTGVPMACGKQSSNWRDKTWPCWSIWAAWRPHSEGMYMQMRVAKCHWGGERGRQSFYWQTAQEGGNAGRGRVAEGDLLSGDIFKARWFKRNEDCRLNYRGEFILITVQKYSLKRTNIFFENVRCIQCFRVWQQQKKNRAAD